MCIFVCCYLLPNTEGYALVFPGWLFSMIKIEGDFLYDHIIILVVPKNTMTSMVLHCLIQQDS